MQTLLDSESKDHYFLCSGRLWSKGGFVQNGQSTFSVFCGPRKASQSGNTVNIPALKTACKDAKGYKYMMNWSAHVAHIHMHMHT